MDPKDTILKKSMYILKIIHDANLLPGIEGHVVRKEIEELQEEYDGLILGGENVYRPK